MGPVANQSLSFCLAVMHTNSQQHFLISPEFKAHQSQLTDPPRAILKKCFILSVRCMWSGASDFASYVKSVSPPTSPSVLRVEWFQWRWESAACNNFDPRPKQDSKTKLDLKTKQKKTVPRATLITSPHQLMSCSSPETTEAGYSVLVASNKPLMCMDFFIPRGLVNWCCCQWIKL